MSRLSFSYAAIAAAGALLFTGCSAATNAVLSSVPLPPINNLLNLDGEITAASVNGTRAATSGSGTKEREFGDRTLPEVNRLRFVRFNQSLERSVTVAVPSGAALPATFSLSNVALTLAVRDNAPRNVSVTGNVGGPITFARVGETNQYQATTRVAFSNLELKDGNFGTIRDIITSGPSPNFVTGRIAFDTDTDQLPLGSVLTFTFVDGTARVGA